MPPSAEAMVAIGTEVLRGLPEPFASAVRDVPVSVADFADDATLDAMGIDDPFDLMGLYSGVPIGLRESRPFADDVDMIYLYRRPILDYWCEHEEDFVHVVRHVLIHEIGHHLGLSDDDMERIEAEADDR